MSLSIQLIFAAVLIASGTQGGVKWALWKHNRLQASVVAVYDHRDECNAQAKNLNTAGDGWRYSCRPR